MDAFRPPRIHIAGNGDRPMDIVDQAFEEVGEVLNDYLFAHQCPSCTWVLIGEICAVWFRAKGRSEQQEVYEDGHPAFESLLGAIRAGQK